MHRECAVLLSAPPLLSHRLRRGEVQGHLTDDIYPFGLPSSPGTFRRGLRRLIPYEGLRVARLMEVGFDQSFLLFQCSPRVRQLTFQPFYVFIPSSTPTRIHGM